MLPVFLNEWHWSLCSSIRSLCQILVAQMHRGDRLNSSDLLCLLEPVDSEAITRILRDQLIHRSRAKDQRRNKYKYLDQVTR